MKSHQLTLQAEKKHQTCSQTGRHADSNPPEVNPGVKDGLHTPAPLKTCQVTQDSLKSFKKTKKQLLFGRINAQDCFNHGHNVTTTLLREVTDRQNIPFLVHALFLLFGDRKKKKKKSAAEVRLPKGGAKHNFFHFY